MEIEKIELPKQLVDNIRTIVKTTKIFTDEEDFITQAILKQIAKYK
jgi:hypothetical protein